MVLLLFAAGLIRVYMIRKNKAILATDLIRILKRKCSAALEQMKRKLLKVFGKFAFTGKRANAS